MRESSHTQESWLPQIPAPLQILAFDPTPVTHFDGMQTRVPPTLAQLVPVVQSGQPSTVFRTHLKVVSSSVAPSTHLLQSTPVASGSQTQLLVPVSES